MTIDSVEIYQAPIAINDGENRRSIERDVVGFLVRQAFGCGLIIAHHSDGAPFIPGVEAEISVSHCRDMAVLAVDRRRRQIGVDIETWRQALRSVAQRLLSPGECRWAESDGDLLAAWTIKEAAYKALRPTAASMLAVELPSIPVPVGIASLEGRQVSFTSTHLGKATITVAIAKK